MPTFPQPFPLHAVLNNGISSVLHGGATGGGGAILFSAGVLSSIRSDITFANSNGISFGLNGAGVITGSVAPGAGAGTGFTTATTAGTNVVGTLGAGGLSMGIPAYLTTAMASNASSAFAGTGFTTATTAGTNVVGTLGTNGISLRVPAYLTTAALSQDSSKYAGTGFTTASTAGSDLVGTHGTNGLSLGVPKWLTAAAGALSVIGLSGGTVTTNVTGILFTDGSGVSWNLNSNTIGATVKTDYAGTGFTTATTAGTNIVGTLSSNGLSLGVPAYLTTAGAGTGISAINVSAGTTSSNVSAITFSNGSGVSFGFDGSNITATVKTDYQSSGAYLTTAALSQDSSKYAGTGFTTASTTGSDLVGTQGTNGLSLGVPAWLTAATAAAASVKFSAGTLSSNRTDVTFGDSNGVTFGLDTNGVITASINQVTGAISNVKFSAGTLSSNRTDLTFGDSNGISFGLNTNGVLTGTVATNYLTTFPRLDQVLDPGADKRFNMGTFNVEFQYAGGGTFSTNATRHGLFAMEFLGNAGSGAHGLHVLQSVGNQVDMHMAHFEAHDTNVLPFHIEGSHSNNMWLNQPINFTTDETAFPIGSVPFIMGTQMSNMVSNLNADYVDGRDGSVLAGTGFTTATTAGTAVVGTLGTNGISMGIPAYLTTAAGSTVTAAGGVTLSQFNNLPLFPAAAVIQQTTASQLVVVPFTLPQAISCSFVRFFISDTWNQPTVTGTSVNTSWSLIRSYTFPVVIMTQGQGASSNSLMYSTSSYCTFVNTIIVTAGAVGSNYTVSITASFPQSGNNNASFATSIATTQANYVLPPGVFTSLAGQRMLDVPFAISLNAGNYWMQVAGFSTDSAGNGPGGYTAASMVPFNWYAAPQAISTWNPFGSASSSSNCFPFGLGSWSTNSALMSTSNIDVTAISAFTDGRIPYFQMLRRA